MFYLFDRVEERSIPRHEGTPAQTPDEATIAHLNVVPREFPGETALAPFHESYLMRIIWHKSSMLTVQTYTLNRRLSYRVGQR